ncbi:MAG: hypothetical protein DMF08_01855, partial [Verrucomicrobia bacterium]
VAPGGSPDADLFRPLRSGGSTSSLINALLIQKSIAATASRVLRKERSALGVAAALARTFTN